MAGFTTAFSRTTLDTAIANTDYIAWSANGSSETANLARTAATAWTASTDADPCLRKNTGALLSAAAGDTVTVSHFAVYSAAADGTQKTDWTALTGGSRALVAGDKLSIAADAIVVSLT
jgi:hypothetical protein